MLKLFTYPVFAAALLPTVALACIPTEWERHDGPVYRDPMFLGLYEAAGDGHVFVIDGGQRAMIYSGDDGDQSSIKLAFGRDWDDWQEVGVLLGPSQQPDAVAQKETAYYLRTDDGQHQIYFIGYADEETYQSEIYLATAPALTGPWTIDPDPVIPRGPMGGKDVYLVTSPSAVEEDGVITLFWLGWNGYDDVTAVWSFAARSTDGGRSFGPATGVAVPIGMEGQITRRPDGGYVAVATGATDAGVEGIFAACADTPLGPWEPLDTPLLTRAGPPWEVDEIIAPAITYDPATGAPYLYYTGAEHVRGWWMMLATPASP